MKRELSLCMIDLSAGEKKRGRIRIGENIVFSNVGLALVFSLQNSTINIKKKKSNFLITFDQQYFIYRKIYFFSLSCRNFLPINSG